MDGEYEPTIQLSQDCPLYILMGYRLYFHKIVHMYCFLFRSNSADPAEIPRSMAFHLCLCYVFFTIHVFIDILHYLAT